MFMNIYEDGLALSRPLFADSTVLTLKLWCGYATFECPRVTQYQMFRGAPV